MKRTLRFALAVLTAIILGQLVGTFGQEPAQPPKVYIYSGTLRSMDKQARTIIVDGSSIGQKFVVPTDAEIIVKNKPRGDLEDLMIGDGIQVKYTEDDGTFVAHQISLLSLKTP